jgi:hypothetical protein
MDSLRLDHMLQLEKDQRDLDGLEQFFKDTLKKCINYAKKSEIITDLEIDSVEKIEQIPATLMMEHMLQMEEYIIPKDKHENEEIVRYTCCAMIEKLISLSGNKSHDPFVVTMRLSFRDFPVIFKIYRYFECCFRIATSHKKILMQCVSHKF